MRIRVVIALAGALLLLGATPAAAQMAVAVKVFEDYVADGQIDPCKHTSAELRAVQKNIPPDIDQYAPDYPAAVAAALEARARGDCDGTKPAPPASDPGASAPGASSPGGGTPAPAPEATPAPTAAPTKTVVDAPPEPERAPAEVMPVASAEPDEALQQVAAATASNAVPLPVALLALLAALMLATVLFAVVARRMRWTDGRLAGPWHAWQEASWRADGVWQDFRDWLRLGR